MIYDVKPDAKLQRNPQISKSFMLRYPQISKSFMQKYPRISKSLAFRTKNKYFPQGFKDFHHFSCLFQVKDISLQKNNRQWIE